MKKPLLAGLVSAALVAGLMPASLAAVPSQEEAGQVLSALDIMVGDQNGDLNLGATVTRAEFTKMVIAASPYRDSAGEAASVSPYPDVPRTHWAAPYVQAAASAGYVSGYLDGTFHPSANITLAEGERVAAGGRVATVYTDSAAMETEGQLDTLPVRCPPITTWAWMRGFPPPRTAP